MRCIEINCIYHWDVDVIVRQLLTVSFMLFSMIDTLFLYLQSYQQASIHILNKCCFFCYTIVRNTLFQNTNVKIGIHFSSSKRMTCTLRHSFSSILILYALIFSYLLKCSLYINMLIMWTIKYQKATSFK